MRELRTQVTDIKFTVILVVFCFRAFPFKMYFMTVEIILWWSDIPVLKTFVFIKLGLKFLSKRSIQLGFFEFLKQVGLIFKGESANISKIDSELDYS